MNQSGIVPLDLRVLLEIQEELKSAFIEIPDSVKESNKYASTRATVLAIGENAFKEWGPGTTRPEPGSTVLIAKYGGVNVKGADNLTYRICNDLDIMAVLV